MYFGNVVHSKGYFGSQGLRLSTLYILIITVVAMLADLIQANIVVGFKPQIFILFFTFSYCGTWPIFCHQILQVWMASSGCN